MLGMLFSVKLIFNKGISLKKAFIYGVFVNGGSTGWLTSKTLMPLPWMIGSLLMCAVWSINFGTKIIPKITLSHKIQKLLCGDNWRNDWITGYC